MVRALAFGSRAPRFESGWGKYISVNFLVAILQGLLLCNYGLFDGIDV